MTEDFTSENLLFWIAMILFVGIFAWVLVFVSMQTWDAYTPTSELRNVTISFRDNDKCFATIDGESERVFFCEDHVPNDNVIVSKYKGGTWGLLPSP